MKKKVSIEDLKEAEAKQKLLKEELHDLYLESSKKYELYLEQNKHLFPLEKDKFAVIRYMKNGRKKKAVVQCDMVGLDDDYKMWSRFLIREKLEKDDGTCTHYCPHDRSLYVEKKRKYLQVEEKDIISIEPFEPKFQRCEKCIWLGYDEECKRFYCNINIGYNVGKEADAIACDRFIWWNFETWTKKTLKEYLLDEANKKEDEKEESKK